MADILPQPSWKRRVGSHTNRGPEPVPGPLPLSSGWEARTENIYQEDSQKVSQDVTDDARMGPWRHVNWDVERSGKGQTIIHAQSTPSPEIHGSPEWSHSDMLAVSVAARWVIGQGRSSSNDRSGIPQRKSAGLLLFSFERAKLTRGQETAGNYFKFLHQIPFWSRLEICVLA